MPGLWVALGTIVLAVVVGVVLRMRQGRVRMTESDSARHTTELPAPVVDALSADDAVTLVQLSTTFCAPCRHARAVLGTLAERTTGLRHVELDITDRPEVALRMGVRRTPTTVALTPTGDELLRVTGVPRSASVREALHTYVPDLTLHPGRDA